MGRVQIVQVVSTASHKQATNHQVVTQTVHGQVTQQLAQYISLSEQERQLRARVRYLEHLVALHGPLKTGFDVVKELQDETGKFEKTRHELEELEKQLQAQLEVPVEQRDQIMAARLEKLFSDVRAKREQVQTYQQNMNYLEEKQARLGLDAGVDLDNELRITRERLAEVQAQLSNITTQIRNEWGVDLATIPELDKMNEEQIKACAQQIIDHQSRVTREREEMERQELAKLKAQLHQVREFIAKTNLSEAKADLLADRICHLLSHQREEIRNEVIDILGSLGTQKCIQLLVNHLKKTQ